MCSDRRKNHGCGQKKPKGTSSAIFGVQTTAKCCELKRCAERVRNRTNKANMNFSPEIFRLIFSPKLNFSPSTKKTTEYSFELFLFIKKFVFDFWLLTFATTRVTMRFGAKNTGFNTGLYPVYANSYWRSWGADGRTRDYYVNKNFLALKVTKFP